MDGAAEARTRARFKTFPSVWIVAALVLFGGLLVGLHVHRYTQVSPIDELQHIDYMEKVVRGHLVRAGDKFGQPAMREEACRGIDAPLDAELPPCHSSTFHPKDFQEAGYNTAYIHPPTYYAIEGSLGWVLQQLTGASSLVTTARLVGTLWLAVFTICMWFLMGEFAIPRLARATVIVLVLTAPTVLHASATVQPDGSALAAGAAMLLATLRWEQRRWHWIVPALVGAAAVSLKVTNGLVVGLCVLYLVFRYVEERIAEREAARVATPVPSPDAEASPIALRTRVVNVACIVGVVVLAALAWSVLQHAIQKFPGTDLPTNKVYEVSSFPFHAFFDSLGSGFSPFQHPYLPALTTTRATLRASMIVNGVLLAGTVFGAVWAGRGSRLRALGGASLVAMLVVGPVFMLTDYLGFGVYYPGGIAPRYGLSIVPAAALVASLCLARSRWLRYGAAGFAAWTAVITVLALSGYY
jgi:hypothetical protein